MPPDQTADRLALRTAPTRSPGRSRLQPPSTPAAPVPINQAAQLRPCPSARRAAGGGRGQAGRPGRGVVDQQAVALLHHRRARRLAHGAPARPTPRPARHPSLPSSSLAAARCPGLLGRARCNSGLPAAPRTRDEPPRRAGPSGKAAVWPCGLPQVADATAAIQPGATPPTHRGLRTMTTSHALWSAHCEHPHCGLLTVSTRTVVCTL